VSAVNRITIARVFNEAMKTLWSGGVRFDMLLTLTYLPPHKKEAAQGLSVSYLKLIQLTCAIHVLRSVYETVRELDLNRETS
jgi:hypothetical protein